MPRDGLSQYAPPPGTNGITNYTIESTKYNGFVADVTQDLNLPRPIVAGGTGANNARDAMTSLQGDVAYQVVTNYDAYAFVSGSFYSAAGATSAPTGNAFIGQCYTSDPAVVPPAVPAGQNMFIEARDVTTGLKYLRQKTAGVWSAWKQQAGSSADLDAAYVNVSGDTMTGRLDITMPSATLGMTKSASGQAMQIIGALGANPRWSIRPGNDDAESSGNAGSNFDLLRWSDIGAFLGVAMNINRATGSSIFGGAMQVNGQVQANGPITSSPNATTGSYLFGNSGTKYLQYDGTNFNLNGGALLVNNGGLITVGGPVVNQYTPTTGYYYFGNSGSKYLSYDGSNFNISGGPLVTSGIILANGYIQSVQAANQGLFIFGSSGTKTLNCDGTNFNVVGGNLNAPGHASVAAAGGPSYSLDVTTTTYAVAVGANFLIVTNFSGLIISTSYATGLTDVFATGGGSVARLGGSGGATAHTACGYAAPQAGYVLTNISGVANTFGVAVIRTRVGA